MPAAPPRARPHKGDETILCAGVVVPCLRRAEPLAPVRLLAMRLDTFVQAPGWKTTVTKRSQRRHPERDVNYIPRVHIDATTGHASCWECCNGDRPCDDGSHWRRGAFAISLDLCPWCDGTASPNLVARGRLSDDRDAPSPEAPKV